MIRLFQLQLEHYEKVEGTALSLEGKANQLSMMVRGNLQAAMIGMVVVPIFGGYDLRRACGRLWDYDATGGRYEEHDHYSVGSGSLFARGALKKLHHASMDTTSAVRVCVEALWDAADDDSATGGPDLIRGILPNIVAIDADGIREVDEGLIRTAAETALGGVR